MSNWEYIVFLAAQALSELGDHLWLIGLRNYFFENSPWTPAAGLAVVFLLQAIPVFIFGPWLTSKIDSRWRRIALSSDVFRLLATLTFVLYISNTNRGDNNENVVFVLLAVQLALEAGSLIFQNCRNCLIPTLYPQKNRIDQAHLWANVASLSAAGVVPLLFFIAIPSGEKISLDWLVRAAMVDTVSFALSAASLFVLKFSKRVRKIEQTAHLQSSGLKHGRLSSWVEVCKRYPAAARILLYSFFYNLLLMGPFEIGHVTFLRRDLQLPPSVLAVNLLLFLLGIFAGTFAANRAWKNSNTKHFQRFAHAIVWDGLTFLPICLFYFLKDQLPQSLFLAGISALFLFHYSMVPFVRVSRLAGIQSETDPKDWSAILSLHAVAVEGAGALSVIAVALLWHDVPGVLLLALGGIAAAMTGLLGTAAVWKKAVQLQPIDQEVSLHDKSQNH
jgi:hypothetical protein